MSVFTADLSCVENFKNLLERVLDKGFVEKNLKVINNYFMNKTQLSNYSNEIDKFIEKICN